MKKIILITLLFLVACSMKKITYKVTYDDYDTIRVFYRHEICGKIGDVCFYRNERYELLSCEEAK